jgi:hypothetical protein
MELEINSKKPKNEPLFNSAQIYYDGICCKFRNYFSEREFRNIIDKNKKFIDTQKLELKYYNYFKDAIENPTNCDLKLLIEFTGALILK